ncbi:MAG: invasion associated locus B family protein [Gammaproteobacteria bacterium]|jgi:invasion protein IalB
MAASCKSTPLRAALRQWRILLLVALSAGGPVQAKPEHGQTFEDWTARCEQAPGANLERCFIFQNLVLKESGKRLVHMAVGYLAANGQAAAVITMPLGISLPPGASISVDGGAPRSIVIERCDSDGCVGAVTLSEQLVSDLKRGREARISFHDGTRRRIAVPVSLLGFTAGFNSLQP